MYKDKEDNSIIGNCDTKLFLGSDDYETQKWLSDKLGERTTTVMNTSWSSGSKGSGSTSYNKSKIALMPINKIAGMPDDECIVSVRGCVPYYGKKYDLTKHPNYNYAKSTAGKFVIVPPKDQVIYDQRPLREKKKERDEQAKLKESKERRQKANTKEEAEQEKADKEKLAAEAKKAIRQIDADKSIPGGADGELTDAEAKAFNSAFGVTGGSSMPDVQNAVAKKIELKAVDNETYSEVMIM